MKILVNCPGGWSHKLYSPERGEGRWCQNYAVMLAKAGHDVHASSGGDPSADEHLGVKLHNENQAKSLGAFDFYFDSAWWEGKQPLVSATWYVRVHWNLEVFLREKLPHNQILAYPYPSSKIHFINEHNPNAEHTFLLPTMFGTHFEDGKFDNECVFISARDCRTLNTECYPKILNIVKDRPLIAITAWGIREFPEIRSRAQHLRSDFYDLVPYDEIGRLLQQCTLNITVRGPANTLDAAFAGVPSLIWERGGFFCDIAKHHGLLIEGNGSDDRVEEVITTLLNDKHIYNDYLTDLQSSFSCHSYENAIGFFNEMTRRLQVS